MWENDLSYADTDSHRFPDFGIWILEHDGVELVKVYPTKYSSKRDRVSIHGKHKTIIEKTLIDGLSSVIIAIYDHLKNRRTSVQECEIELLNVAHLDRDFENIFGTVIRDLLFGSGKIGFLGLRYPKDWFDKGIQFKPSRNEIKELVIVDEVNRKIIGIDEVKNDYTMTPGNFRNELRKLARDNSFIEKIYDDYGRLFTSTSYRFTKENAKTAIINIIKKLENREIIEWKVEHPTTGMIIKVSGIMRDLNMDFYYISEINGKTTQIDFNNDGTKEPITLDKIKHSLPDGNQEIESVFIFERNSAGDIINKNGRPKLKEVKRSTADYTKLKIDRAFRLIQNPDTGRLAMVETTDDPQSKVENPSGWSGIVKINNKIFSNPMLTDQYGNFLSSRFFNTDPNSIDFLTLKLKRLNDFKDEFDRMRPDGEYANILTDIKDKKYGVRVLMAFSASEGNRHSNHLLKLYITNPAFISDDLETQCAIQRFEDPFAGLYELIRKLRPDKIDLRTEVETYISPHHSLTVKDFVSSGEIFRLYRFLFTARKTIGKPKLQQYALDLLGILNVVYDPQTGKADPDSKRDQAQIEGIISELYKGDPVHDGTTKSVMYKFCLKWNRPKPRAPKTNLLKAFMTELYSKIKDYDGSNPLILAAKNKIIKNGKVLINPPSSGDPVFFETNEVQNAESLFKVISYLLGHGTIRLIFARMLNVYSHGKEIKIAINDRPSELLTFLNAFNFVSSSQERQGRPININDKLEENIF